MASGVSVGRREGSREKGEVLCSRPGDKTQTDKKHGGKNTRHIRKKRGNYSVRYIKKVDALTPFLSQFYSSISDNCREQLR